MRNKKNIIRWQKKRKWFKGRRIWIFLRKTKGLPDRAWFEHNQVFVLFRWWLTWFHTAVPVSDSWLPDIVLVCVYIPGQTTVVQWSQTLWQRDHHTSHREQPYRKNRNTDLPSKASKWWCLHWTVALSLS